MYKNKLHVYIEFIVAMHAVPRAVCLVTINPCIVCNFVRNCVLILVLRKIIPGTHDDIDDCLLNISDTLIKPTTYSRRCFTRKYHKLID